MPRRIPGEPYERIANFHGWLIPPRIVLAFISFGSVFVFIGTILLAIGRPLTIPGAILLAIGLILVLISLGLVLHSCFVMRLRDQETQTFDGMHLQIQDKVDHSDFIPTYAVIDKKPPPSPSSLKNGRNTYPKKFVTLQTRPDYQTRDRHTPVDYTTSKHHPPPYGHPNPQYPIQMNGYANYDYPKSVQSGFPLHPSQPTPYSTLTGRDQMMRQPTKTGSNFRQPTNYKTQMSEDYDNTLDTTPMMSFSSHGSSGQSSGQSYWRNMSREDDIPEPQPLVYPSERRPMTFQQTSSSKMSIYDNVQFGLDKAGEE